ncbi:hypothetical protein [Streptomyces sp. F-1]|uniref:hypothetical protein n=1 Tax=Streptomyces sp. F-1 TaxID=463642 RepID=UPI000868F744|nr:hypothetical protein [Streptomyces sp. F-1]SFY48082.1 hypothetical protein STEPF1_01306 [Streptomyces sp. F-1]
MSTDARRASVPPRPASPPGRAGNGIAGAGRVVLRGAGAAPGEDPDEEPSVFAPRGGRPTAPDSGPVPEAAGPTSPPPPPASARFPDAPPRAGRAAHPPAVPAGPAGSERAGTPGPDRTAQEGARPPRRPDAPEEPPTETTARPRPVPPAPAAQRSGSGPADAGSAAGHPPKRPGSAPGRPGPATPPASAPAQDAAAPRPGRHPHSTRPATTWHPHSARRDARPVVTFGEPEVFRERARARTAVAGVCLVLGLGLIGGAVTGSWLARDGGDGPHGFAAAASVWHSVPVDRLFPPVVRGPGAGPGGADRTWTRIAVAPDSGCADAFDPLLRQVLAPVGCGRLLRATYTDATQSHVTTVGLLFTTADPAAMSALATRFRTEHLTERPDLVPRAYGPKGTLAAGFGDAQRASWTVSVRTDAPVVVYAVSGWADGRTVDTPQPAADAVRSGATTPQAQSGLGNEAKGLAGQIERLLRQTVGTSATKRSS